MRTTTLMIGVLCGWLGSSPFTPAEAATGYRCTLPDGQVVYTELRPPDAQCQPLGASGHVRSAPPPTSDTDTPTADPDRTDTEQRRQACAAARRNLELLESDRPVSRTTTTGEQETLDAEQRAAALDRTRDHIDEWCDDAP